MRRRSVSHFAVRDNTTMLNILALEEKKKILVEYRFRLAIVSVFAVGALVLASLILLIPSYILATTKYSNAEKEFAVLEGKYGGTGKEKDIATQIRDINTKIALLLKGSTSVQLSPLQAILEIVNIKGDAIKVSGFMYDPAAGRERIVLNGVARDRDSLANFIEMLKKEPTFVNVTLPISSYVKSVNIDFSIVVERSAKVPSKK